MTRTTNFSVTTPRNWRRIALWSILVLLAFALRGALSWTSLTLLPATGDEASSVLLAKFIANGERPLLFIGQPYQFPFESYLLAPFVDWLPRNALGARSHALVLGGMSVLLFIAAAWKMFPAGKKWPAILLLIFPSAYWLQHQSGYTPPQYAMTAFFSALVVWLTILAWQSQKYRGGLILLAGLFSGLLVSNNISGLTILIGSGITLALAQGSRRLLPNAAPFGAGLVVGLTPYLLAKLLIPGAYEAVTQHVSITQAWHVLTEYALTKTLPGTMGINPTLFTDVDDLLGWPDIFRQVFLAFFLLVLSITIYTRTTVFIGQIRQKAAIRSYPVDLFLITTVINLFLFVFYERAYEHGFRFLLPVAWCFPYILGYAAHSSSSLCNKGVLAFSLMYVCLNLASSVYLILEWNRPGKIQKISDTLPLDDVLAHLAENNIKYCYASFWHAYRITFESDEKIICSQPYNERFPFWRLPYKPIVDNQVDTPYILTDTPRAILTSQQFISHLKLENVHWKRTKLRPYYIFSDFTHQLSHSVVNLLPDQFTVRSDNEASDELASITDGNPDTVWSSDVFQQKGDLLELDLHQPRRVRRISLYYNHRAINHPKKLRLTGIKNNTVVLQNDISHYWTRIVLENNKPVYGGLPSVIWLESDPVLDKIIVEIIEPDETKTWNITDIEIGILPQQVRQGT